MRVSGKRDNEDELYDQSWKIWKRSRAKPKQSFIRFFKYNNFSYYILSDRILIKIHSLRCKCIFFFEKINVLAIYSIINIIKMGKYHGICLEYR